MTNPRSERWIDRLVTAAANNDPDAVEWVIAEGGDVNGSKGVALWVASANRSLEVLDRLLAAGADIHAQNDRALQVAARNKHPDVAERLLDAGADVEAALDGIRGSAFGAVAPWLEQTFQRWQLARLLSEPDTRPGGDSAPDHEGVGL